jgi:hypothetical protein
MQEGSELSGGLGRTEVQLGHFNGNFCQAGREIMQGRRPT